MDGFPFRCCGDICPQGWCTISHGLGESRRRTLIVALGVSVLCKCYVYVHVWTVLSKISSRFIFIKY